MKTLNYYKEHPIFQNVPIKELEIFSKITSHYTIDKGESLIKIGEDINHLYFLKQGLLNIYVRSSDKMGEFSAPLKSNSIIGEMELLERRPTIATVVATKRCALYKISYDDYHKHILEIPNINIQLFKTALSKWRNIENQYHKLIDELEDVGKLLLEQQNKIEEESKLKEIFIENVSHDLRTPLTIIQGVIESLEIANNSNTYLLDRQSYNFVKNSSSYLLDLINDLLDISQLSQGFFRLNTDYYDIKSEFEEIFENLSSLVLSKGLTYNYKIENLDSILLLTDLKRLRQIIYNLLSNAIKYTEKGFVSVLINFQFLKENNSILKIQVSDSGIGMTQEEQKIIFNKFVRAKNKKYDFKGTGLGLSIVDNLIRLMKGKIIVNSEIDKGSEFLIEIPIKFTKLSSEADKKVKKTDFTTYPDKKMLLIDDFEDTHEIIKALLKNYPVNINSVYNGKNIINFVKYNDFDIVLIDIMMPDIDGYQVLKNLNNFYKEISNKKKPLMIAFTALSGEEELNKLNKSGFDGYLLKPFTKNSLIDVIYKKVDYLIK